MDTLDRSALDVALNALGALLASRGHRCEVVLIGGGNLLLRAGPRAYRLGDKLFAVPISSLWG